MSDQLKHVFLIDGSGFLFRAFHALPPMTRDDGTPVNAVFGFTKMVMKLIDETDADYMKSSRCQAHLFQPWKTLIPTPGCRIRYVI